jgi:plasmid stability protein
MATLYVENIPEELYKALRRRAREHRKSIAAEVISLLERNIPTADELRKRREFVDQMKRISASAPLSAGPFPSSEEMIREDRRR